MGFLKRIIHERQQIPDGFNYEMTMMGEPMIYSIKYQCGSRLVSSQSLRNKAFLSMLKCRFVSYKKLKTPLVILVKFYISPLRSEDCSYAQLRAEKTPAAQGFELSEYILSFKEMLKDVLFASYRQIVKIDAVKFFSNKPRTVFKFMTWEHYEHFLNINSINSKAKNKRTSKQIRSVQPEQSRNEVSKRLCSNAQSIEGTSTGTSNDDLALQNADPKIHTRRKKKSDDRIKPLQET